MWSRALTLILKLIGEKIKTSLNGVDKIAIRITKHQCTLEFLRECNFIIGTSVNVSGTDSYRNSEKCYQNIHNFDLFLDVGIISSKGESTIIEFEGGN